jgi:hypothetical protein
VRGGEHFFNRLGQMNAFGKAGFFFGRDRVAIERDAPQFIDFLTMPCVGTPAWVSINERGQSTP